MSDFYAGLADIFEVPQSAIGPQVELAAHNWDSLAIVSTIALIDEVYGELVDGASLAKCATVADLDALIATVKA
jgi:acyl carrier protein